MKVEASVEVWYARQTWPSALRHLPPMFNAMSALSDVKIAFEPIESAVILKSSAQQSCPLPESRVYTSNDGVSMIWRNLLPSYRSYGA